MSEYLTGVFTTSFCRTGYHRVLFVFRDMRIAESHLGIQKGKRQAKQDVKVLEEGWRISLLNQTRRFNPQHCHWGIGYRREVHGVGHAFVVGMSNLSGSHKAPAQAAQDTQVAGTEGGKVMMFLSPRH